MCTYSSKSVFVSLVYWFDNFRWFYEMGFKKQNSLKKAENGDFRFVGSLFKLICTLPYFFLSFIRTILPCSMMCENTRKSLNQQKWVWLISKY